jgi:hypothetical protein
MLGLDLLGLGLLTGLGDLTGLGLSRVHTTQASPGGSTIAARGTLPSHTLARGLLTALALELLELEAELGNFSNQGVHS